MKNIFLPILALMLAFAPVSADASPSRGASAGFSTLSGCVDETFGVTVTDTSVEVFYLYMENCEFGTSWSFGGSVPLERGAFRMKGLHEASLAQRLVIDGNEVILDLTWTAEGKDKEQRPAAVTGSFVVNGMERITDGSLSHASLSRT